MKKPRILPLLFLLAFLAACSQQVQVVTLRSQNVPLKNNQLLVENDTLRLQYSFYGPNGSVRMSVFNKLNVPLYVNWKKSAFIQGRNKFDYWEDEATLDAVTVSQSVRWLGWLSTDRGYIQGTIRREDRVSFIPPKTEIRNVRFVAKPGDGWKFSGQPSSVEEIPETWNNPKRTSKILHYQFDKANTPLAFRNFLTFSLDEQFSHEFYLDNEFYASDVTTLDGRYLYGPGYDVSSFDYFSNRPPLQPQFRGENQFLLKLQSQ